MKKYDYVDTLRGLAILLVIYVHNYNYFYFNNPDLPLWFLNTVEYGQRGVQLFFIASAFTLCLSLESRKEKEKNFLINFFLRRFFRIAPLFYLILTIILITSGTKYSILNIFSNFSFLYVLHPIGHIGIVPYSWTIGVEMLFYLLFPILFLGISNLNRAIVATLLFALLSYLSLTFVLNNISLVHQSVYEISIEAFKSFFYKSLLGQLPIFLLGFVLFYLKKEYSRAPKLIILLLAFIAHLVFDSELTNFYVFGITLMIFSLWLSYKANNFLINTLTVNIGKVSYSMYLTHAFIFLGFKRWTAYSFTGNVLLNIQLQFILVIVICFLVSKACYHLIEKPGIQLGQMVIIRLSKKTIDEARA